MEGPGASMGEMAARAERQPAPGAMCIHVPWAADLDAWIPGTPLPSSSPDRQTGEAKITTCTPTPRVEKTPANNDITERLTKFVPFSSYGESVRLPIIRCVCVPDGRSSNTHRSSGVHMGEMAARPRDS